MTNKIPNKEKQHKKTTMKNSLKLLRVQKLFLKNAYKIQKLWPTHLIIALTHYVQNMVYH